MTEASKTAPASAGLHEQSATRVSEHAALRERVKALQAKLASSEAVVADQRQASTEIVHDLRNATNSLGFIMEGLRVRYSDPREQGMLETALRVLDGMNALIDDLLLRAMVSQDQYRVSPQRFPLASELRASVDVFGASAATPFCIDCDPSWIVETDRRLLHRIVGNLVANAVRHADGGRAVRVSAERTGRGWRVLVHDRGPGIPEHLGEAIWEWPDRFTLRKNDGLGFGLGFARRSARLLGGDLRVVPGASGACFELALPHRPPGHSIAAAESAAGSGSD